MQPRLDSAISPRPSPIRTRRAGRARVAIRAGALAAAVAALAPAVLQDKGHPVAVETPAPSAPPGALPLRPSAALPEATRAAPAVRAATAPSGQPYAVAAEVAFRPDETAAGRGQAGPTVSIDVLHGQGPVTHVGQGFLHSVYATQQELALFGPLAANAWRSSISSSAFSSGDRSRWNAVQTDSVPTTLILSDMWRSEKGDGAAPWSNWISYRLWVESTVLQIQAAGYKVGYWEVYNEPDQLAGYYSPSVYAGVTASRLLEQFLVAYQAIRAVDGSARILGPSLATFEVAATGRTFSMAQFIGYAAANGLTLAGLTWHYNGRTPAQIVAEAGQARRELARFPGLGHPDLFVNEYGSADQQRIPGWDLAYLAALNAAGVSQANRSCWDGDCSQPDLDGLLTPAGSGTRPDYWVRLAYAAMSGLRVAASWSAGFSALASYDPGRGLISVLVGRAVGCRQDPRCRTGPRPGSPVTLSVGLQVPWSGGAVQVRVTRISGRSVSALDRPSVSTIEVPIARSSGRSGQVRVPLPSFADGDVVVLQVRRA